MIWFKTRSIACTLFPKDYAWYTRSNWMYYIMRLADFICALYLKKYTLYSKAWKYIVMHEHPQKEPRRTLCMMACTIYFVFCCDILCFLRNVLYNPRLELLCPFFFKNKLTGRTLCPKNFKEMRNILCALETFGWCRTFFVSKKILRDIKHTLCPKGLCKK